MIETLIIVLVILSPFLTLAAIWTLVAAVALVALVAWLLVRWFIRRITQYGTPFAGTLHGLLGIGRRRRRPGKDAQ